MALKVCRNCGRKFSAVRARCPYCRRRHFGDDDDGLSRFGRFGVVAIAVLVLASAAYNLSRETGPPPELEARHSPEAAIAACRQGIEAEFAAEGARAGASMEAEYLGGGEYEVRGPVTLSGVGVPATSSVFCEAQFRSETGWTIDVELGT